MEVTFNFSARYQLALGLYIDGVARRGAAVAQGCLPTLPPTRTIEGKVELARDVHLWLRVPGTRHGTARHPI